MSDLTKIKKARVFKGAGYTDGSHPNSGNLVLMNGGEAFFGGVLYRRQGTAPVLKYAVGDRVTVVDHFTEGKPKQGTVVKITPFYHSADGDVTHDFPYEVALDGEARRFGSGWTTSEEHLADPVPEPTHKHPEGLYQDPHFADRRVYVHREDEPGRYRITYLGEIRTDGTAVVNRNMTDFIVSFYTLVAPA